MEATPAVAAATSAAAQTSNNLELAVDVAVVSAAESMAGASSKKDTPARQRRAALRAAKQAGSSTMEATPAVATVATVAAAASSAEEHGYSRDPSDKVDLVADEAAIHSLIADRLQAKRKREFDKADNIRDALLGLGVEVFDRSKYWRAVQPPWQPRGAAERGAVEPQPHEVRQPSAPDSAAIREAGAAEPELTPTETALAAARAEGLSLLAGPPGCKTGYLGVRFMEGECRPFKAWLREEKDGELVRIWHLGYWDSAEEAALAYARKAEEIRSGRKRPSQGGGPNGEGGGGGGGGSIAIDAPAFGGGSAKPKNGKQRKRAREAREAAAAADELVEAALATDDAKAAAEMDDIFGEEQAAGDGTAGTAGDGTPAPKRQGAKLNSKRKAQLKRRAARELAEAEETGLP